MTNPSECKCGEVAILIDGQCDKCRAIPYKDLFGQFKESLAKNPPPPEEALGVLYPGKCLCCSEHHQNLIYGACKRCRELLGQRCGRVARQIRSNPAFAKSLIDNLHGKHREAFITIFGLPEPMCE